MSRRNHAATNYVGMNYVGMNYVGMKTIVEERDEHSVPVH